MQEYPLSISFKIFNENDSKSVQKQNYVCLVASNATEDIELFKSQEIIF